MPVYFSKARQAYSAICSSKGCYPHLSFSLWDTDPLTEHQSQSFPEDKIMRVPLICWVKQCIMGEEDVRKRDTGDRRRMASGVQQNE